MTVEQYNCPFKKNFVRPFVLNKRLKKTKKYFCLPAENCFDIEALLNLKVITPDDTIIFVERNGVIFDKILTKLKAFGFKDQNIDGYHCKFHKLRLNKKHLKSIDLAFIDKCGEYNPADRETVIRLKDFLTEDAVISLTTTKNSRYGTPRFFDQKQEEKLTDMLDLMDDIYFREYGDPNSFNVTKSTLHRLWMAQFHIDLFGPYTKHSHHFISHILYKYNQKVPMAVTTLACNKNAINDNIPYGNTSTSYTVKKRRKKKIMTDRLRKKRDDCLNFLSSVNLTLDQLVMLNNMVGVE